MSLKKENFLRVFLDPPSKRKLSKRLKVHKRAHGKIRPRLLDLSLLRPILEPFWRSRKDSKMKKKKKKQNIKKKKK